MNGLSLGARLLLVIELLYVLLILSLCVALWRTRRR